MRQNDAEYSSDHALARVSELHPPSQIAHRRSVPATDAAFIEKLSSLHWGGRLPCLLEWMIQAPASGLMIGHVDVQLRPWTSSRR